MVDVNLLKIGLSRESTRSMSCNPRNKKELENYLLLKSYPPYDIEWVDCGLAAVAQIDAGNKDVWLDIPVKGHQMTAEDIAAFLRIDHLL
jgi:hypothetical protein